MPGPGLPVLPPDPRGGRQMPGLTVDRYGSILVAQVLSLGMEQVKDVVFAASTMS